MTTNKLAITLVSAAIVVGSAAAPGARSLQDGPQRDGVGLASTRGAAAVLPVSVAVGASVTDTPQQAESDSVFVRRRPVIRVGQDYALPPNEVVWELRSVLGDVVIGGRVERDAVAVLGDAHVARTAVVENSLVVLGGNVTIEPGAVVSGDLFVIGGSLNAPAGFSPGGAFVAAGNPGLGNAVRSVLPWLTRGLLLGRLVVPDLGWVWLAVGLFFLVSLAVSTLFDGPVSVAANAVHERPLSQLLLGLLVLILTIPAIVVLAATVVGIVVLPFLLCALLFAGLIGKAGVARAIGWRLTGHGDGESRVRSFAAFVAGSAVLFAGYAVPVLGIVAWSLTTAMAVGASAVMLRGRLRQEWPKTEKPQPEEPRPTRRWWSRAVEPPPVVVAAMDADRAGEEPVVPRSDMDLQPGADSNPDADSRPGGAPRAAFLDRVAAFAIDCVLVGIGVLLFDLSRHDGAFPLMLLAYHVAFWAWKGTSLGGVVVGLQVVRLDGSRLRPQDAVIRGLCAVLSVAALGIGCFWMLQDPDRQMWHDKIVGTEVLRVPRELVLQ